MTASTERAILAGGCFWGMQDLIRRYPGVISTRVGYSGGDVPNATYRNHGTHAEAIEIVFDPDKTSFRKILEYFFQIHDPTTKNRQGNDMGASYRSAIFYTSEEQKAVALIPSPTSMPRVCGLARRSPSWRRPAHSGRPSRSIRTISSATRTATPAISRVPTGSCPSGTPRLPASPPSKLRAWCRTHGLEREWPRSPSGHEHARTKGPPGRP